MSGDESMLKSYQQGKDLYATMGVGVYKNDYWDNMEHTKDGVFSAEGKKRRGNMKKLLLGITYQMGAKSISVSLNSSLEEAQQIVNNFYDGFPKIKKWMDDTKESCRKLGYVEDFWGRRRRLPDILLPKYEITDPKASETATFNPLIGSLGKVQLKTNPKIKKYEAELDSVKDRKTANLIISQAEKDGLKVKDNNYFIAQAERQCVNARIQGSAATLTKMAMVKIFNDPELKRLGFKLSIAVHDELIGECPEENKDECAKRLSGLMIATAPENGVVCPMKCDSVVEKNWYTEDYTGELIEEYEENIEKNGMSPEQAKKHLVDDHEEASEEFFKNLFEKLNCA